MTRTLLIDFETLNVQFDALFKQPTIQEVYYEKYPEGWTIQFYKDGYYIKCHVTREEIIAKYRKDNAVTDPIQLQGAIGAFEAYYLKFAIPVKEEAELQVEVKQDG